MDGQVSQVALDNDVILNVIGLESLIVDRVVQATDKTGITFDEAVRLCVAGFEKTDWGWVDRDIERRESDEPALELRLIYAKVMSRTRTLLGA